MCSDYGFWNDETFISKLGAQFHGNKIEYVFNYDNRNEVDKNSRILNMTWLYFDNSKEAT